MLQKTVCAAAIAGLAACSGSNETTAAVPAVPAVAEAPYNSEINVLELMVHGMDPAAQAFWKGWREMADEKGLHDLPRPTRNGKRSRMAPRWSSSPPTRC
jgi:hypothetical protein